MKSLILKTAIVLVVAVTALAGLAGTASAHPFGGYYDHYYIGPAIHGHYDYQPGYYQQHYGHFDYVPGHYDFHGHFHP